MNFTRWLWIRNRILNFEWCKIEPTGDVRKTSKHSMVLFFLPIPFWRGQLLGRLATETCQSASVDKFNEVSVQCQASSFGNWPLPEQNGNYWIVSSVKFWKLTSTGTKIGNYWIVSSALLAISIEWRIDCNIELEYLTILNKEKVNVFINSFAGLQFFVELNDS